MGRAVYEEVKDDPVDEREDQPEPLRIGGDVLRLLCLLDREVEELVSAVVERVREDLLLAEEFFVVLVDHLVDIVWYKLFRVVEVDKSDVLFFLGVKFHQLFPLG